MRAFLKRCFFAFAVIVVSPLLLLSWLEAKMSRGELLFSGCAQLLAMVPSHLGVVLRAAFYWGALTSCSWETHIGFGSLFTHRGARVARNVSTGAYCVLGHVEIGARVMMGSRVSVPSGKRQHFGAGGEVVATARYDTVRIGEGTWVGEGAIILADVGSGCVVSAGAVVTRATPEHCIVGGNPAQVLKSLPGRNENHA